jgi:fatty-acyl-CoA synthase
MAMNVATLLEMAAGSAPERIVIGSRRGGWSYARLWDASNRAADLITALNVENVVYVGLNSPQYAAVFFGAAIAGKPFSPLNYRWDDELLADALLRQSPAAVVVGAEFEQRCRSLVSAPGSVVLPASDLDRAPAGAAPGTGHGTSAIAVALFTSGTSGAPKIALLGHDHLASYVLGSVDFLSADEASAQLVSVPPYHIAGIANLLSSAYSGRRIVHLASFEPLAWLKLVETERITNAMVVPTMLGRILDTMESRNLPAPPTLRHLSSGGGRMPLPLIERAARMFSRVDFVNGYGLTETSSTVTLLSPDDHANALVAAPGSQERARLASVGRALPSIELSIRDETGRVLPPRAVGEIWVRGPQVSGRYREFDGAHTDGWFCTRDAGWLDEEGYLFLQGRLDDVIIRGGENISPGEVEDVLLRHPAVADCGVFSVPDDEWGEAVAAAVVLAEGALATDAELAEWVRGRLRGAKTPQVFMFLPELPYNDAGKLLRRSLRAAFGSRKVVS